MHVQRDSRIALNKAFNDVGQRVARLGVGGRYVQRAFVRVGMLAGDGFDRIHFGQNFTRNTDDFQSCWRYLSQVLATAGENLDTQLIFQHPYLLTDAGL
ncbi:hypothetical protein D3C76_1141390 [compost metagenome]